MEDDGKDDKDDDAEDADDEAAAADAEEDELDEVELDEFEFEFEFDAVLVLEFESGEPRGRFLGFALTPPTITRPAAAPTAWLRSVRPWLMGFSTSCTVSRHSVPQVCSRRPPITHCVAHDAEL